MKLLYFTWLLLLSSLSFAQTARTDLLYKTDRSSLPVKVDELTDTDVVYTEPAAPTVKKTIARKQVWKIVFSDGSVELITPQAGEPVVAATDQITLLDGTTVAGKVVRRDDRKLYYTKPGDLSGTTYELLLGRLDRIQYASGRLETFSKTAGVTAAPATANTPQPGRTQPTDYASAGTSASYVDPKAVARLHITIGPELAHYDGLNRGQAWLSDSLGFGMRQNIGASLRVDYLLLRRVGVSLTAGYAGWELKRNYVRDGLAEFSETKQLTQIPLQLGLKLYPFSTFYVMPEAGVNLMFTSVRTTEGHPTPANESVNTMPTTYGGSVGYEIRAKALLLDLSLRYQIQNIKNLNYTQFQQSLNESINVVSLRVGIGFGGIKR